MIGPIGHDIPLYSPTGEYNSKNKFTKWRTSRRFVQITDKEINKIKMYVKILKQLFAEGEVIIGEYSPRLRLARKPNSIIVLL